MTRIPELPRLYAIVDVEVCVRTGWTPRDLTRAYLGAGVGLLQLRAKETDSGAFVELAASLQSDAVSAGARLVVNDRADVAAMVGAAGVHVGQDDLPVADARRVVGESAIVGLSTHSETQVVAALATPLSYLAVGPAFATATKDSGYDATGLSLVAQAAHAAKARGVPVVAIGGITLERAPAVIAAGADAVAVISDLLTGGDPARRARAYLSTLA